MPISSLPRLVLPVLVSALLPIACGDSPAETTGFSVGCEGAYEDAHGYCRAPDGRFANGSCCETACGENEAVVSFDVKSSYWAYAGSDAPVRGLRSIEITAVSCQAFPDAYALAPGAELVIAARDSFRPNWRDGEAVTNERLTLAAETDSAGKRFYVIDSTKPADPETLDDYVAIERETREQIVEYLWDEFATLSGTGEMDLAAVTEPAQLAFASGMDAYMRDNGSVEVEDDYHATVGDVEITLSMILLPDGTPIGGEIRYFQNGCDMPDESSPHFDTEDDAEAAGCDFSDVSWSNYGYFDYDLSAFSYEGYMSWSGY